MASKIEIDACLGEMIAAFGIEMDELTMQAYEKYLSDLDSETLKHAVGECIATCKFFPKVAEIREKAGENALNREGVPSAAEAWAEVQREMHDKGCYHAPEFSHPLVREAMHAVGGWPHLTTALNLNLETVRAQYIKIYENMVSRLKHDNSLLPGTRKWLENNTQPKAMPGTIKALAGKMRMK